MRCELLTRLYRQAVSLFQGQHLSVGMTEWQPTASTLLSSTAGLCAPSLTDSRIEKSFCPLVDAPPDDFSQSSMVQCEQ